MTLTNTTDASTRRQTYTVPTHINKPDKLLFGLTARQLLLLITGASLAYATWLQALTWAMAWGIGLLWSRGLAFLAILPLVMMTLAGTFLTIADRPLELWVVVWMRAHVAPVTYVWRSAKWDEAKQRRLHARTRAHTRQEEQDQSEHEQEGWS
ncbi:PrgI family protein [Ktedonobacter racemifer]|uniref:PrgI family protein n=1 Tax=Ktedonobacter racemifer DSM 44963 TaxID=485913 RepID=D6TT30_KTERA|nr:PrgI family protein [Ktedonobacter racemifer]EFH83581.1 hypothetical protein Krac_4568 [Ktedonobacter racemifer DSM 44963]